MKPASRGGGEEEATRLRTITATQAPTLTVLTRRPQREESKSSAGPGGLPDSLMLSSNATSPVYLWSLDEVPSCSSRARPPGLRGIDRWSCQ